MKKTFTAFILIISISTFAQVPNYVPTNGLIGWYPFNNNANDLSPSANNGVVTGATLTTDRNNLNNSAFFFETIGWNPGSILNEIFLPYINAYNSNSISINCWIYPINWGWPGSGARIIGRFQFGYSNPNGQAWALELNSANTGSITSAVISQSQQQVIYTGNNIPTNQWSMLTLTFDGSQLKTYKNSLLISSVSAPLNFSLNTAGNSGISIGVSNQANGYWYPYKGKIDDIGIWNRALTACEINQLYSSSLSTISIQASSNTICVGQTASLNVTGANTYTWSTNQNTAGITLTPSISTNYSVIGTTSAGCTPTAAINISVNPLPTISVNSGTICNSQSFTLVPNGANTYTISGGNTIISPSITTSYSVTGTSTAGCISASAAVATVTVFALPQISVNSGTICNSQSFTLIPIGANTYTIQGGNAVVSPSVNSSYSVSGTSTAGCISASAAISNVTVYALPVITANSGSICNGQNFTISPSGANTYTIQGGTAVVSPSVNSSYSVSGTSTVGCISASAAISNVTVYALPVITANSGSICNGQNFTISPSGANTYTIQGGTAVVSPSVNSSYSVSGTSTAGCISASTAISNVTVYALPVLSISGNTLICTGETGTITVSGANAYAWSNGATSTSITINNTPNTYNYTVTGTGTNSCTASTTVQVLINACTSIAQNQNKYLDIYPNPASSLLNIGASDQAIGKTLKIFDAQSKLIQVLVLNTNNVLQLSDWAKGIYLIQVSELGISKRIVIE